MKKSSALALLAQLKAENEAKPAEETELTPLRILDILLDYINDQEIREAVDEINF
jgi:hypothetical protein